MLEGTGDPDRTVRPQAVLTFDDGDRGLARHLVPILKDEGVPVTVYVATEQFETGKAFWFDRVVNALHAPRAIDIDLKKHGRTIWHFPPVSGKPRWSILGRLLETLKAADPALRETLTEEIVAQAPAGDEGGLGPMSRRELRHLADLPGVTIGAHSHGHELLDQIPLAAARESIARSRALLRDWTGQKIRHFAFPNGNHSAELRTTVRDLGFSSATILEERTAPRHTDPFALPRISVGRYDALARFKLRLAGL